MHIEYTLNKNELKKQKLNSVQQHSFIATKKQRPNEKLNAPQTVLVQWIWFAFVCRMCGMAVFLYTLQSISCYNFNEIGNELYQRIVNDKH